MAGRWRALGERVFGPHIEAGGPGAGVQLWWSAPTGTAVLSACAVLEVLQPPAPGVVCAWGLQATIADGDEMVVSTAKASASLAIAAPSGGSLEDVAAWMELASPPAPVPIVARWSNLSYGLADGSVARVSSVLVTFPVSSAYKRWDVAVDDVGVLQVAGTRRRTRNRSVLSLPTAR